MTAPRRKLDDCPPLHPEEHAWLEWLLDRKLSTREAQDALKDAINGASAERLKEQTRGMK